LEEKRKLRLTISSIAEKKQKNGLYPVLSSDVTLRYEIDRLTRPVTIPLLQLTAVLPQQYDILQSYLLFKT
jgi:hypothetical protein